MSSKKWLITFFLTILMLAASVAGLNAATDPFGVFGDAFFQWHAYNETKNPRTAKITYLEKHHQEYDSYIIGCSSTSSFPTEALNQYFNADFYNMIMYGADMLDVEKTCRYLIDHYTVKNLVLNVYITNGETYDEEANPLTYRLHEKVSGESKAKFYSRYLFANTNYAVDKIKSRIKDTKIQQPFDVFNETTGAYDKSSRDAEPIGDLPTYLKSYPVFVDYPHYQHSLKQTENCMKSVMVIRNMCQAANVNLTVVCAPVYHEHFTDFNIDEVSNFYTSLAEITPYWDFTLSSVSYEPRYFYDETHFRNAVGTMAVAKIFGDKSIYIPDDFGVYVTQNNIKEHILSYKKTVAAPQTTYTTKVPVLMYHHIDNQGDPSTTISPQRFEEHLSTLKEEGYHTVTSEDLLAYVKQGKELPEKPLFITFDDGYLSNYLLAYPLLKKYDMKATVFAVGSVMGDTTYKETNHPILPHFSQEQAAEMVASGVMDVQSHTYDMHQWQDYETNPARDSILRFEKESEYIQILKKDCQKESDLLENAVGKKPIALAFPNGKYDTLSQIILIEEGIEITFGGEYHSSTIIKGLPQSLYSLGRFNIDGNTTPKHLLSILNQ